MILLWLNLFSNILAKYRMTITVQSAKAKARRLQQHVRDCGLAVYRDRSADDVRSCPMGSTGADLLLSPLARRRFPYSVECKAYARHAVYA